MLWLLHGYYINTGGQSALAECMTVEGMFSNHISESCTLTGQTQKRADFLIPLCEKLQSCPLALNANE